MQIKHFFFIFVPINKRTNTKQIGESSRIRNDEIMVVTLASSLRSDASNVSSLLDKQFW